MKLAILGNSPLALEAALRFHLHGAALTWYIDSDDLSGFTSMELSSSHFTSDLGRSVLQEMNLSYSPKSFSWQEWQDSYWAPLVKYLKGHQEVKTDEVLSVTKRFLASGEQIPGRSRFLDLFRVIYRVNPSDFIEQQKETNPETYQRLTEEVVNSLTTTIEMFQDYDLILDLRSDLGKASASVTGRALGEGRETPKISYGPEALKRAHEFRPIPELRELALVGSDSLAAETLLALEEWIKEPRSRLFVVSAEEDPFSSFLEQGDPATVQKLKDLLDYLNREFQEEIDTFTRKLREWQELDDFVQVKIPRPSEPIPRLNFFSAHNVTAMDELIDRKRMFLTLEIPEFRQGKKHPENNILDLKTIGVDHILVTHARKSHQLVILDPSEPGYFNMIPTRPNINQGWDTDLEKLEGIENEIFKLFSPAGAH